MTNETLIPKKSRWSGFGAKPVDWLGISGLIALLPLMVLQFGNLWSRQHLQFFPVAFLGFFLLVFSRGSLSETTSRVRYALGWCSIVLALIALVLAVLAFSPWVAQVSLVSFIAGWLFLRLGAVAWYTIVSWVSILIVTLPLPMNLDERLIQNLQLLSSSSASSILDLLGVSHLQTGNVIEIAAGKLFVDRACSGVGSLYALIAVTMMLTIFRRTSFLISLLSLASVPLWAWFGNVIRLVVITAIYDRWSVNLTEGWQHSVVGLATFSVAFACLIVSVELSQAIFKSVATHSQNKNLFHRTYNQIIKWPAKVGETEDRKNKDNVAISIETGRSGYVFSFCFLLLGLASVGPIFSIGPWKREIPIPPKIDRGILEALFSEKTIPVDFAGFNQVNFAISQRDRDDVFGEYSVTWQFIDQQSRHIVLSLDMPFSTFHQLEECYILTGSSLEAPMVNQEVPSDVGTKFIREGTFQDNFGEHSHLFYMEFSREGRSVKGLTRWERLFPEQSTEAVFQLQLLVKGQDVLNESDKAMYREVLINANKIILPVLKSL